jgi:hypothetical protein
MLTGSRSFAVGACGGLEVVMAGFDAKKSAIAGTVVTKRVAVNIVESTYAGRMTPDLVGVVKDQLKPFLEETARLDWLIDLGAVTGVDLAPSEASSGFYAWFRSHGGDRIALVVRSAMVRMVIAALAFAMGNPARVFESRAQALDYLQSLRRADPVDGARC